MASRNTGGIQGLSKLGYAGLLALGIIACASTVMQPDAETRSLTSLRVDQGDEGTRITLVGVGDATFTAYAQGDPERIVVDLTGVEVEETVLPISVEDGLVEEVRASVEDPDGDAPLARVEVVLAAAADHFVAPDEDGLVVEVRPVPALEGGDRVSSQEISEVDDDGWTVVPMLDEGPDAAGKVEPTTPASAPPATRLVGVEADELGEGVLVRLRADGTVANVESFTLEDPDRLVVDLPGLLSAVERNRFDVGSPLAERIRIGQHADMVRVVIDGGPQAMGFEGRRVVPAPDGLLVALGDGQAVTAAIDEALAAPAPPRADSGDSESAGWESVTLEEATPAADLPEDQGVWEVVDSGDSPAAGGRARIRSVDLESLAGSQRVRVEGDRPVDYLVYEPSSDTVVLSIQNAVLEPGVDARIAAEPGGPVALVTAFAQPETRLPEVRVVVTRAADLKPSVAREGKLVTMDFPRTGAVAQVPPVLDTVPGGLTAGASTQSAPAGGAAPPAAIGPAATTLLPPPPPVPQLRPAAPAASEPGGSISVLREGGLMDGKRYTGRRISLDFKDIEMADVLRLIAEVSDLNVIAGDEVKGRVTIRLLDIPWDQALDVVLLTKGLGFVRVGNVLRIAPSDVLKQEEEARLQERRALEQLEDLIVKLEPINYADVKDVHTMVRQLLTPRGTVQMDKRTNTLIIKDIPSVVDEATALIKAVDTQTPQVMIEAKIVEANLDFSREFGTVWGIGAQPLVDAFDSTSGFKRTGGDAFTLNPQELGNNATFINPLTAGPTALFNLAGFVLDEKLNLELQLQAAEVNGDGKVISSPRLVTLDNNKATIEQGVSIPFQTFENGDAQLEFVDAVLKLDVTPHITADRSIIMKVVVSRNAPDDSVFTLTGSPAIAKNQVNTETLVKDGQTLVIGGIYVVDKGERQSRVPYLHKLPLIGAAFRSNEISDNRKELLIFVTPRVVQVTPTAV